MSMYIRAGLIDTIRKYIPNEINKYIESKINRIIFPTEITHMIIRYVPKEIITYLKNKIYYSISSKKSSSNTKTNLFVKPFDWKRLHYDLYKTNDIKIEYQYPKKYDDIYLNGLINKIKPIIFGYENKFKIMNFGKLYVKGDNNTGQLGLGDCKIRKNWTRVILRETITWVASGDQHSIILTNCGKAYITGLNRCGQIRLGGDIDRNEWVKIDLNEKIIQIECGYYHFLLLTENGNIYGMGYNDSGELGLGSDEFIYKWRQIFLMKSLKRCIKLDEKIIQIGCGHYHSLLLTENGNVYGTGENEFHQLGLRKQIKTIKEWKKLILPEKIIQISCGDLRSMALTISGIIYVTGAELQSYPCYSQYWTCEWTKIKLEDKIVHIKCESEYTIIITENGKKTKINIHGDQISDDEI